MVRVSRWSSETVPICLKAQFVAPSSQLYEQGNVMEANQDFVGEPHEFYALVKLVSESVGYSTRKTKTTNSVARIYTQNDVAVALEKLGIINNNSRLIRKVSEYSAYRASALNEIVAPALMDRIEAKALFEETKAMLKPTLPPIMNKQKGEKRHESYLTCLVQMVVENHVGPNNFNRDPQNLSYFTDETNSILTCFSRRFDGAVPSIKNPKAVWEIKEYYGTTTFGSRVADGVYETLLDGYELRRVRATGGDVRHMLFIDGKENWWKLGKSYLCRLIDMLHTEHLDRLYIGRQVTTEFPNDLRKLF